MKDLLLIVAIFLLMIVSHTIEYEETVENDNETHKYSIPAPVKSL